MAVLFLLAPFLYPIVTMVGSYPPITAPALVLVGSMMAKSVVRIDWKDQTEAIPAFLTMVSIPLFYSIADGLSIGLMAYPLIKKLSGKGGEFHWSMWPLALLLVLYFIYVRPGLA